MREKIERFVKIYAFSILFSSYVTMLYIFSNAYDHPSKRTVVWINAFGEANVEAAMLLLSMPCIMYWVVDWVVGMWRDRRK